MMQRLYFSCAVEIFQTVKRVTKKLFVKSDQIIMVDMVVMATEQRQTRVQADNEDEGKREWAKEKIKHCKKAES